MKNRYKTTLVRKTGTVITSLCLSMSLMPLPALAEDTGQILAPADDGGSPSFKETVDASIESQDVTFDGIDGLSTDQGGAFVIGADGNTADVTVNGDVDASGSGVVDFAAGGNTNVTVTGDVNVTSNTKSQAPTMGGVAVGSASGTADVKAGNINVKGDAPTSNLIANASYGGTTNVSAGNLNNSTPAETAVIAVSGGGGTVNVKIKAVEATKALAGAIASAGGMEIGTIVPGVKPDPSATGGVTNFSVDKSINNGGEIGLMVSAAEGGVVNANVGGNVSNTVGVGLVANVDETSKADILVANTIYGKHSGVMVDGATKNIRLTTWRIKSDGEVIGTGGLGREATKPSGDAEDFAKSVNYIVKLEQPTVGGKLYATNSLGQALARSHGFDVANEDDTVLLKVDLQPGYKIMAAFNGEGKETPLTMDSNGNYFVKVERGGGVYLSVTLDLIDCAVVFANEDGSVLQKDVVKYGTTPSYTGETPTKADDNNYTYTFAGWKPQISPVTGDVVYVATFNATKKEEKKPEKKEQEKKESESKSTNSETHQKAKLASTGRSGTLAATSDATSYVLVVVAAGAAAGTLAFGRKLRA